MPTVIHNADPESLLKDMPARGIVGARKLLPVLQSIAAALKFKLDVEGMNAAEIPGGFHLDARGAVAGLPPTLPSIFAAGPAPSLSVGDLLYLTAAPIGGSPNLQFVWQFNSGGGWADCAGGIAAPNEASFYIYSVGSGDAGSYRCTVSNDFGTVTTDAVSITVT